MHPIPPPLHKQFRRQLGPAIVPVIPAAGNPKETTAATVVTPAPVAEPTTKADPVASRVVPAPVASSAVVTPVAPVVVSSTAPVDPKPVVVPSSTNGGLLGGLLPSTTVSSTAPIIATVTVPLPKTTTSPLSTSTSYATVSGATQGFASLSSTKSSSFGSSTSSPLPSQSGSSLVSNGPSTGTVIGIVAGALVGAIVLATIIGFCVRKKFGKKKDQDDHIFDKDDFRRESVMLDDDEYSRNGNMQEYNMSPMVSGLGRNPTLPNGNGAPRAPSSLANHYNNQQMQPSFQPGEIFQHQFAPPASPGMDLYGGYPVAPANQQRLDRELYQNEMYQNESNSQYQQHPNPSFQQAGLARNISNMSNYSHGTAPALAPPQVRRMNSRENNFEERRTSPIQERLPSPTQERRPSPTEQSRSGTPVNSNVQQSYFAHSHNESTSSSQPTQANHLHAMTTHGEESFDRHPADQELLGGEAFTVERAERKLSVRNNRPSSVASDGYGGYA